MFLGLLPSGVQARGGGDGDILPQGWTCWPVQCLWETCGTPPFGMNVLEVCYAEGRGYWYRVTCYDECP